MRQILFLLFIIPSILMLTSCAGAYQTLTDASLKHDGSLINAQQPAAPKQTCNQWCHNGWCSTHCVSDVN